MKTRHMETKSQNLVSLFADAFKQEPCALALRLGSLRVSLADTLTACKTAVRVINEGYEEEL
jgi:hypothetical protein